MQRASTQFSINTAVLPAVARLRAGKLGLVLRCP
jgi:hypothetical protein